MGNGCFPNGTMEYNGFVQIRSSFFFPGKKNMGHYEEALPMLEQALSESWRMPTGRELEAFKDSSFEWSG